MLSARSRPLVDPGDNDCHHREVSHPLVGESWPQGVGTVRTSARAYSRAEKQGVLQRRGDGQLDGIPRPPKAEARHGEYWAATSKSASYGYSTKLVRKP